MRRAFITGAGRGISAMRRVFITGAGRGIGLEFAHSCRGAGRQAIATCAGAALGG